MFGLFLSHLTLPRCPKCLCTLYDVVQPPAQEEILDDRVHDDLPDDLAKDLAPLVAATAEINPSEAQAVSTMLASTTGDLIGKVLSAK